jgi:hypothetical protein
MVYKFFTLRGFYFLLNLWEAPRNAVILFFGCQKERGNEIATFFVKHGNLL